jgi:tetratricopeptide (TPR) repeat protein
MSKSKINSQTVLLIFVFFPLAFACSFSAHAQETTRKVVTWNKLSDRQIARMFFPKEKLYFQPSLEGLPMDAGSLDGVNVYGIERLTANLDNDLEHEMAVAVHYTTGMCTFCASNMIFAILDRQDQKVRVAWRTEEGEAFQNYEAKFSTMKVVTQDKFLALTCIYDDTPLGTGRSYRKMKIIRWNGKKFIEIWNHDVEGYDGGNRGGIPHDYLAKVEFIDGKGAKRITVKSMYATRPNVEEKRTQVTSREEFAWNDKEQTYQPVMQSHARYEGGQECVYRKEAARDETHCSGGTALQRGTEYLRAGSYDEAIRVFNEVLEANPSSAEAFSGRGHAHYHKKDYNRAILDFNEALRIDPASADTYRWRGFTYVRKGDYDRAIADYTKVLQLIPKDWYVLIQRARAYQSKGQYPEAITDYTRASEVAPAPQAADAYSGRGAVYHTQGDYDRAISDYSKAVEMSRSTLAVYARGLAYWKNGQLEQAIADLANIVPVSNAEAESYYYRGRVYVDKGDYDRAVSDFEKALEVGPTTIQMGRDVTEVYFFTAQAYERLGLTGKAVAAYKAVIKNSLSNTATLVERATERIAQLEK